MTQIVPLNNELHRSITVDGRISAAYGDNRRFAQVTHDKFYLVIETSDPGYEETETPRLLEATGSKVIELVED